MIKQRISVLWNDKIVNLSLKFSIVNCDNIVLFANQISMYNVLININIYSVICVIYYIYIVLYTITYIVC